MVVLPSATPHNRHPSLATPKPNMVSLRHIHKMTSYTHFELFRYCGPLSTSPRNLTHGLTPNLQSPLDPHALFRPQPHPPPFTEQHTSLISLSQNSLFAPFLRCSTQGPGPCGHGRTAQPGTQGWSTSAPNPPACRSDAFPTTLPQMAYPRPLPHRHTTPSIVGNWTRILTAVLHSL